MMTSVKLLIADDEAMLVWFMEASFRKLGYEVCKSVATGQDAIRTAIAEKPDVVLMDIRLVGEMDGIAAAKRILEMRPIPIIFMTGYSDKATEMRARALAPAAFLVKPITAAEVQPVLQKLFPDHG
jgi:CheY-like chemotaxis protein